VTYLALANSDQLRAGAAPTATPSPLAGSSPTPAPQTPDDPSAITRAVEMVSPAVVTITVREGEATDPFSLPETGVGSGVIYDSAGWVLTNRHVVEDATQVTVQLNDRSALTGTVYGVDTLTDLAIVKLDATDLPTAPIGDSSTIRPGQTSIAIGSPLGTFTNSVTSGIISALGRQITVTDPVSDERRRLRNLIQTDAAINQGNSGGPLLDENGMVIGVSTALAQGAQGIFFAIPINIAKPIMAQALEGEPLTRPWIGIIYVALDRNVAEANDLPIDYGAWIAPETGSGEPPIIPDSPAAAAGLQPTDIITAIDGRRIDAGQGLDDVLSLYGPGDELSITVLRDGESIELMVTLGVRPAGLD
jgi:S1-C subfamily serine protease